MNFDDVLFSFLPASTVPSCIASNEGMACIGHRPTPIHVHCCRQPLAKSAIPFSPTTRKGKIAFRTIRNKTSHPTISHKGKHPPSDHPNQNPLAQLYIFPLGAEYPITNPIGPHPLPPLSTDKEIYHTTTRACINPVNHTHSSLSITHNTHRSVQTYRHTHTRPNPLVAKAVPARQSFSKQRYNRAAFVVGWVRVRVDAGGAKKGGTRNDTTRQTRGPSNNSSRCAVC